MKRKPKFHRYQICAGQGEIVTRLDALRPRNKEFARKRSAESRDTVLIIQLLPSYAVLHIYKDGREVGSDHA
jgi:hypothetical protein